MREAIFSLYTLTRTRYAIYCNRFHAEAGMRIQLASSKLDTRKIGKNVKQSQPYHCFLKEKILIFYKNYYFCNRSIVILK